MRLKDKFHSDIQQLTSASSPVKSLEAASLFTQLSFPDVQDEEWKYSSTRSIQQLEGILNPQVDAVEQKLPESVLQSLEQDAYHLVLVNGVFSREYSRIEGLPEGVEIGSISEVSAANSNIQALIASLVPADVSAFSALNLAFAGEGAAIFVASKCQVDKPIYITHFLHSETTLACNLRYAFALGKWSKAEVIQRNIALNATQHFVNEITEIQLQDSAALYRVQEQTQMGELLAVTHTRTQQDAHSIFEDSMVNWSGKWVRNTLESVHQGSLCETHYNGLYIATGNRHIDNHTLVDHAMPHCESNETYKGIMADASKAVFNGKIMVRQDAQKTNAYQSNANLLVSENATINAKPQLEIFADDVKCSHGATIGQLDPSEIFYLRSRGISEPVAHALLTEAFAADVLEKCSIENVRERLASELQLFLQANPLLK